MASVNARLFNTHMHEVKKYWMEKEILLFLYCKEKEKKKFHTKTTSLLEVVPGSTNFQNL